MNNTNGQITEEQITKLLDEYQTANMELELSKLKPIEKPIPVPCTIEQYALIESENRKVRDQYQEKRCQILERYDYADKALFQAIPSNVWIYLPSRKLSIGFSTGTWGGGCHALQIAKDGEELPKLEHITYYP